MTPPSMRKSLPVMNAPSGPMRSAPTFPTSSGVPARPAGDNSIVRRYPSPRGPDAGVADPVKLATWMVRFSCEDQDFFEVDPVRYADALGERGLPVYRRAIDERGDGERVFAVRWARERLAVLDGDGEAIVALLGGDLSAPHQFIPG